MTRLALLIVFFLIFSKLATAQLQEGSISGKVIDGGAQKIIDAATISLYKAKDSSLVKVNLADNAGNFLFEHTFKFIVRCWKLVTVQPLTPVLYN